MAEPGLFLWLFEEDIGFNGDAAMKTGVSCVALSLGLFTATMITLAQTTSPTVVAQGPSSAPASGVLATPPAAPVSVPPSGVLATPPAAPPPGVLATLERHRVGNGRPLKITQNAQIAVYARHDAPPCRPYWTAPRRDKSTRRTILAQNIAPTLPAVSPPPEEGRSFLRSSERQKSLRNDEGAAWIAAETRRRDGTKARNLRRT